MRPATVKLAFLVTLMLLTALSACNKECDLVDAPLTPAVDCGLQTPFRTYSQWTYRDAFSGDTAVLRLNAYLDENWAAGPPCERYGQDVFTFQPNSMNLNRVEFRHNMIVWELAGEWPAFPSLTELTFMRRTRSTCPAYIASDHSGISQTDLSFASGGSFQDVFIIGGGNASFQYSYGLNTDQGIIYYEFVDTLTPAVRYELIAWE